jgi:hypothetical protein
MWKKVRILFKDVITGGKIGLLMGLALGLFYGKWHNIEPASAYHYIVLAHMQVGTCIGGIVGGMVKLVRMWRERKQGDSVIPAPLPEGEGTTQP